ncbi:C2 domain containing protein [Trema orientale]|uniref:C2 domain containing protein n=1 Tax=Trema orientale TaxID=63057 RepID=A0A2P5FIG9_TREOI|nr:C2 domain containing protein [Trema orientale]
MDSYNQRTGFRYNLNSNTITDANGDSEFSGVLEIYVHHARNIHNICIYDNQDVYAKFSLTYNPDETLSTRIIAAGGKNPDFNENLRMKITQIDAVLKCEIWMLSRARNLMEDQLLGFALVPISQVVGKGKLTRDYSLSSTDLFHSPAGTVQLTLSLDTSLPISPSIKPISESSANSSITSEVVLLDRKISEVISDPVEYSRIEFPDINVVRENQQMVSEYFDLARPGCGGSRPGSGGVVSFLHLGASPQPADDYEMTVNSSEETQGEPVSPNGSIQNSGFFSSTTTSLSTDDRNSADSIDKKNCAVGESSNSGNASITTEAGNHSSGACPDTPTSRKGREGRDEKESNFSSKEEENNKEGKAGSAQFGKVFSAPLGNINLEAEQSAMQQQIVDMYMRSMQQFTESLANMKLPMDLDKAERQDHNDVIRSLNNKLEVEKKKDGSRVFYGSRAFF